MKKLFTLATSALMAMSAWAAAPELFFGTTPVLDGATYQTGYTVSEQEFGALVFRRYVQDSDLFIKAKVGQSVTVEVNADKAVQVCSIDGRCSKATSVTKDGKLPTSGQDITVSDGYITAPLLIDVATTDTTGADAATLLSNITVNVKVYYTGSVSDAVTCTVVLTNRPASEVGGIASVGADNSYIRLAQGNTLEYSFSAPTKLNIYGVSGALVLSRKVYSTGSLSLDSLHPGVYIYQAGNRTGKMVIRK